jgi:hypothetical protein
MHLLEEQTKPPTQLALLVPQPVAPWLTKHFPPAQTRLALHSVVSVQELPMPNLTLQAEDVNNDPPVELLQPAVLQAATDQEVCLLSVSPEIVVPVPETFTILTVD